MRAWMVVLIVLLACAGLWWWLERNPAEFDVPPADDTQGTREPATLSGLAKQYAEVDRKIDAAMPGEGTPDSILATNERVVHVTAPEGQQPEIVLIRMAHQGHDALLERTTTPWTAALETITLDPDARYLVAETLDGSLVSKPVRIPQDGPITLELEKPTGGRLLGTIKLPDGLRVQQPMVVAVPLEGAARDRPESLMQLADPKMERARIHTDVNGYSFDKLSAGRYQVALSLTGHGEIDDTFVVEIAGRLVRRDLRANLELAPVVEVMVLGRDGTPAAKAQVQASYEAPRVSSGVGATLRRDDGAFLIRHDRMWDPRVGRWSERHPEGVFRMRAILGKGRKEVAYDPRRSDPIVFEFFEPTSVVLHVEGLPPAIAKEATLQLVPPSRDLSGSMSGGGIELGPGGIARFESIQPGEYEARLIWIHRYAGSGFSIVNIERFPVTVAPGDGEPRLSIPKLYEVEVTAPDFGSLSLVRIDDQGAWTHQIDFNNDKSDPRRFRYVPAGRYEIRVNVSRTETRTWPLEVPKQLTITLK